MSRSILKPVLDKTKLSVRIDKGGCEEIKPSDEAAKIGLITTAMKNSPNGVGALDANGSIDASLIPATVTNNYNPYLTIPELLVAGNLYTFPITNYDAGTNYTVSVTGGTVELFNDTVKFRAPLTAGSVTLTINGRDIVLTIQDNVINKPTILAPTNYSNNVPAYATITSSNLDIATGREIDKLLASDGTASDSYGIGVSVSGDGQWMAVGAYADDNAQGTDAGKVYIYQRNGNSWTEVSAITEAFKRLGFGLGFNEDGSKLVAGSYVISGEETTYGHAKVFTYTLVNGIPTKVNEFLPETTDGSPSYTTRPVISKDGLVMAVGLFTYDVNGNVSAGIVYIYDWNATNNTWTYRTSVQEPTVAASNLFGTRCSFNLDGSILVTSAYADDTYSTDAGIVYVYDWNTTTSTYDLRTTVISSDIAASDWYGYGVDISSDGSMLTVGARGKDTTAGVDAGKVYVYQWNTATSTFDELYTLEASDAAADDQFGSDVSITTNKDLLVVGAISNDNSNGVDAGAVYTFIPEVHQSSSWELATDPNFTNIIQSSSNDTINLTSWNVYDLLPATDYYARVKYTGTLFGSSDWSEPTEFTTEQQFLPDIEVNKLLASDGAAGDHYGVGVSVSGDGQWLAVGATGDFNAQGTDAGKVYIYQRNGNSWTEVSTITEAFKRIGFRLGFNEDGSKLVVGSYVLSGEETTYGHAKVFTYTLVNGIPTKVNEFRPETTDPTPSYVTQPSMSKDGLVMAVGLYTYDNNGLIESGIVYIYDWNATNNTWTYRTTVQEPTVAASNLFGTRCSLNIDGSILTVSAFGNDTYGTDAGIVYVYDWNTTTSTYDLRTTVISSDIAAGDWFGYGLNISSDGSILAVGAMSKNTTAGVDAGKVYVFKWNTATSTFDELYTLEASDAAVGDNFGADVSITTNKDLLVAGSRLDDNSNGVDAGAVYTFR